MRKIFVLVLSGIGIIHNFSFAQSNYRLSGLVTDENQQPLIGATVFLQPVKQGAITDSQGKFVIDGLSKGIYSVQISFVGYTTLKDTIAITANRVYNAQLEVSPVGLHEVVVTSNYEEERKKEESLNIEIVNDDYLKQNLGGSLMQSLERLPGVSTIDIGSGQSKPVIRGLAFNRVVVVENNVKHEGQQWGADHGLEIDQYAIDNVEVIKGPASLMYGSDAIGGVIDMKNKRLPQDNSIGATIDISGKTNNDFIGASTSLFIKKNWFYADFRATLLDYGDYKVPTDSVDIYSFRAPLYENHLRNTAGKEQNLHASFGIVKQKFQTRFFVSNVYSKSGFFANAHGLEPRNVDTDLHDASSRDINYPYQEVRHIKLTNSSTWTWESTKLETDLGFQRNFRQEWSQYVNHGYMPDVFPDTLSFNPDLERQFEKYVYTGNVKVSHCIKNKVQLIAGVNSNYQDNAIDGRGFIIPAFKQLTVGGFAISKFNLSEISIFQVGLRYDYGSIKTQEYYDWFTSPVIEGTDTTYQYLQRAGNIDREFSNVSWSIGYNYNPGKWSFKANVGKSFRMPIAKELAANGVNYHHFSYEVGDPDLSPEISYQLDVGVEYNTKRFAIGTTPFLNYFSNYIYLNPSDEHDRLYGNGNQVFYYTQSEVFRFGGEIHSHYQVLPSLQIGLMGEYVYSEQLSGEKKGYTLPFSPPASAIVNVKYYKQQLSFIENAYVSVDYRITAPQNKIVPPEVPTDGYQTVNVGLGGELKLGNQRFDISMQVQNLLNNKYFNHTSYYRLINVPEPGRNFIVNISIPFSIKI